MRKTNPALVDGVQRLLRNLRYLWEDLKEDIGRFFGKHKTYSPEEVQALMKQHLSLHLKTWEAYEAGTKDMQMGLDLHTEEIRRQYVERALHQLKKP